MVRRSSPQVVRVRIAPSPTGIPHIGNTRTALFNFLFARHNKGLPAGRQGKFILRIEDTDRVRLVEGAEEAIKEILNWLSLVPDEIYKQSERLEIYKEHAQELLKKRSAFEDSGAVRFKTQKTGQTSWTDAIGNKEITFQNSTQEDFVILKSDGYPTYNFANVIDDHLMEITHTIRGDEFISSTPKHIMLYEAFGWEPPVFAHLPIILGPDKSKLSKRHGAKSVLELRDEGYLKEAIINFMAFLGWTPPSGKEILTLDEMISEFDLKDVNLASPIFDATKLIWMSGGYVRDMIDSELVERIVEFYGDKYPRDFVEKTIPLVKERMKTLKDYSKLVDFAQEEPDIFASLFDAKAVEHLNIALRVIQESEWDVEDLKRRFIGAITENSFDTGTFFMDLRSAVAGSHVTPPIVESIVMWLDKEVTLRRIQKALEFLT